MPSIGITRANGNVLMNHKRFNPFGGTLKDDTTKEPVRMETGKTLTITLTHGFVTEQHPKLAGMYQKETVGERTTKRMPLFEGHNLQ